MSSFNRISELLQNSLQNLNLEKTFKVYSIWKQWKEIVGSSIADRSWPDYLQGNVLFVSVANSVWMSELEKQKRTLLEKLKELKLDFKIEEIRFRVRKEG